MSDKPLLDNVLQFTEKAGEALVASHDFIVGVMQEQTKAAQQLPKSVSALAETKTLEGTSLISEEEKALAHKKLASHHGALEVLRNVLDEFQTQIKQASQTIMLLRQGKPHAEKAGASTSIAMGSGEKPESWRMFESRLGL